MNDENRRRGASRGEEDETVTPLMRVSQLATGLATVGPSIPGPTTPVVFVPGQTPIGGGSFNISDRGGSTVLATYSSPDNKPREVTVVAWGPFATFTQSAAVATAGDFRQNPKFGVQLKITVGGPRGGVYFYKGVPCVVRVTGSRVTVEGSICELPYQLGGFNIGAVTDTGVVIPGSIGAFGGVPIIPADNANGSLFPVSAVILEEHWPEPDGEDITTTTTATWTAPQFQPSGKYVAQKGPNAIGPCVVTSATLTNTTANLVCVGVFDRYLNVNYTADDVNTINGRSLGFVFVPPGGSAGVGRDLLGSFFMGCSMVAITQATAANGAPPYTVDTTNGPGVLVNVRGFYLGTANA